MNFIDLAVKIMHLDRSRIKDMTVPCSLVYDYLVSQKEITPIEKISYETKRKYWKETDGERYRRVIESRSLYLYDTLKKEVS